MAEMCPEKGTLFSNSHEVVLCVAEILCKAFLASMPKASSTL